VQNDCLTLREYESFAVKYLWKTLPVAARDNEHIGRIMEYMIRSDLTYKHEIGSLEGRRMTYAKFAVQHIKDIVRRKKIKNRTTYSLDKVMEGEGRGESSGSALSYNELSPTELAEIHELKDYILSDEFTSLESCAILEYYLEKASMKDIADKFNITRMAVWLAIERGLEKLRKLYGEKESC
jgi:DNA-directed RNA polymerase specialized sigma subunit